MIDYKGVKLPDGEMHLVEWMEKVGQERNGRPLYQAHKYEAAIKFCRRRRVALDMGAHVGLWTYPMALDFETVYAFEPMPEHAACWRVNLAGQKNAILRQVALGCVPKGVRMHTITPGSSGDTCVALPGESGGPMADVQMITIDSLDMRDVDFIKCDHEGYEYFALKGAEETLKRCRPVVIVEQKPGHGSRYGISDFAARDYLKTLGMVLKTTISGDCIMAWE